MEKEMPSYCHGCKYVGECSGKHSATGGLRRLTISIEGLGPEGSSCIRSSKVVVDFPGDRADPNIHVESSAPNCDKSFDVQNRIHKEIILRIIYKILNDMPVVEMEDDTFREKLAEAEAAVARDFISKLQHAAANQNAGGGMMGERLQCSVQNAPKFLEWIRGRGGVAVWRSINLSNPGASWSTPAMTDGKPTCKPTWQAGSEPERVITDANEIDVVEAREVKRFHVAVRRSDNGLMLKVTDGGSRRIRRECEKAGEGSWYEFDYGDYNNAVIYVPGDTVTLAKWASERDTSKSRTETQ
ncbi:MAG: hypothetical protein AMS21_01225 [Gemmatimonas sp. SG8_38_2]|nr:MAG: hypothetical protein AMS21_01225 [Gemmatimonas sp. SG8_38_2]